MATQQIQSQHNGVNQIVADRVLRPMLAGSRQLGTKLREHHFLSSFFIQTPVTLQQGNQITFRDSVIILFSLIINMGMYFSLMSELVETFFKQAV